MYDIIFSDMQDEEISGPTYTYDERKKHECIDTGIPPIKKGTDLDAAIDGLSLSGHDYL